MGEKLDEGKCDGLMFSSFNIDVKESPVFDMVEMC
jgi:hypothetical protein